MSKDTESVEPTLSDDRRAEFERRTAVARRFRERSADAAMQAAVGERFTFLETERARLVEENRRLAEALRPFAATWRDDLGGIALTRGRVTVWHGKEIDGSFSLEELKRAHDVLKEIDGE